MRKTPKEILVACDAFKDALPALSACKAIERGLKRSGHPAHITLFPLADGGEGTAEVFCYHLGATRIPVEVHDPLFRIIESHYFLSSDSSTAFIEMSAAAGLQLLPAKERNPMHTTTLGVGELIADALRRDVRRIILGIGGSATNDCGIGMASALGWRFLDKHGDVVKPVGGNLSHIGNIDSTFALVPDECEFEILCDVNNVLFGTTGAAYIYGPQKGATKEDIESLDNGLRHISRCFEADLGKKVDGIPGSGAAGGMGAAGLVFLNGTLRNGAEVVIERTGFEAALRNADLLITGEGQLDGQTAHGKLIFKLCTSAQEHGVPVIALCGAVLMTNDQIESIGLQAAFPILRQPCTLEEAIAQTEKGLEQIAFQIGRLFY